jgi:hypothetical protein
MKKETKAFKDTLFGKIIGKAANVLPDIAGLAITAIMDSPMKAVKQAMDHLTGNTDKESIDILDELKLKLAEIELEFSKIELQETQAYLADMQNARSREVEMAKTGASDWFMYVVGFVMLLAMCVVVYVSMFMVVEDKELFYFIAGAVLAKAGDVVSYFFGSSKGSKDKTKMLGK